MTSCSEFVAGFLPCCWLTRTCLPLLFERKPPDSPSVDPSVQLGQEWGRWPAHCSHTHTRTNRKDAQLQLTWEQRQPIDKWSNIQISSFHYLLPIVTFFMAACETQQTHSLWTRWLRRSCVMSSCQDFLMPAAEGGVAVGMEPRFPTPSFIKLRETTGKKGNKE